MKARQISLTLLLFFYLLVFHLACVTTPVLTTSTDEELILKLFKTEDELKMKEDITPLYSIYAPSVVIYHGNRTPGTSDDFLLCDGIGEVISFYQNFFNMAENIQHKSIITNIIIDGDEAWCKKITSGTFVRSATKEVGVHPEDIQPWKLKKINGVWQIIEATWFTNN